MKTKYAYTIMILLAILIGLFPTTAMAEELDTDESSPYDNTATTELPPLYFYAVNVGYKDDVSAQNYDFFELRKTTGEDLSLEKYQIIYTNSSSNASEPISFEEGVKLRGDSLVFGFSKSPQYVDSASEYLYTFSSSGLASTAGKLSLYFEDELTDEICWGKLSCDKQIAKFVTTADGNYSYVFDESELKPEKYYPEIVEDALWKEEPENHPGNYCQNLRINEIYSYYESSVSEQFVELYNSGEACSLEGLHLRYKGKSYALSGDLTQGDYFVYQDDSFVLTKDPSSQNILEIVTAENEILDSVAHSHGQKSGLSYNLINNEWKLSYARTPGEKNIYQEFRTCPEGKEINPDTGNCINSEELTETVCPEGKYLNPDTGRCKNIESDPALTECAEGYERNPETNRCRKIQTTDASEYAVKTAAETSYSAPKRFAAYGLLALAVVAGMGYLIFQFRSEIGRFFRKLGAKMKNLFSRSRKPRPSYN